MAKARGRCSISQTHPTGHGPSSFVTKASQWIVELPDDLTAEPAGLPDSVLTGGIPTYERSQAEARQLRSKGATALSARSTALLPAGARGWKVDAGLHPPLNGTEP